VRHGATAPRAENQAEMRKDEARDAPFADIAADSGTQFSVSRKNLRFRCRNSRPSCEHVSELRRGESHILYQQMNDTRKPGINRGATGEPAIRGRNRNATTGTLRADSPWPGKARDRHLIPITYL